MKILAILLAKIALKIGRMLGRGSSLPGKIAMKIDPKILKEFSYPDKLVFVTGTNGKTSTTHFIAAILEEAGMKVCHNKEGANMPQGICTVLIENSDLSGKIKADACVLEVDEGFLKKLIRPIRPKHLVITNLFDDQKDRFASVESLADSIKRAVLRDTSLIVNANDPVLASIGLELSGNEKNYFGADDFGKDMKESLPQVKSPRSEDMLDYSKRFYDKIGYYSDKTGFKTPEIKYLAKNIDLSNKTFELDGESYKSKYGTDYYTFNILGAISYAREIGIKTDIIKKAVAEYSVGTGRLEEIGLKKHKTFLNLVKNPAGLDRSLTYIDSLNLDEYILYLAVNKRPADGEDASWLSDLDYEVLKKDNLKELIIAGEALEEIKEALEKAGIDKSKIKVDEDTQKTIEELGNGSIKPIFLTNYTAMEKVRNLLK